MAKYKKIESNDLISPKLVKQLGTIEAKFKTLSKSVLALKNVMKQQEATSKTTKASQDKLKKALDLTVQVDKEYINVQKRLISTQAKSITQRTKAGQQLTKAKIAQQANNREVNDSIMLAGRNAASINKNNASLKQLEAALRINRRAYTNLSN